MHLKMLSAKWPPFFSTFVVQMVSVYSFMNSPTDGLGKLEANAIISELVLVFI